MLKCISSDGFEDAARRHERPLKVAVLEGAAAVGERLLENGPKLRVVHELESAGRGAALDEAAATPSMLDSDVPASARTSRIRSTICVESASTTTPRPSDRTRKAPLYARASQWALLKAGKLIDDGRTVLLPRPDGIDRARILDLTSSSNQRIEPIQRDVAVGSQVAV